MKNIKLVLAIILTFTMLFALCACSDGTDSSSAGNESKDASVNSTDNTSSDIVSNNSEASVDDSSDDSSDESAEEEAKFIVKVVDANGNAIKGAYIQLCKDSCIFYESDDDGIVKFNDEITDGYKLSVLSCPDGYVYEGEAEVYLESGITEYTVTLAIIEG